MDLVITAVFGLSFFSSAAVAAEMTDLLLLITAAYGSFFSYAAAVAAEEMKYARAAAAAVAK